MDVELKPFEFFDLPINVQYEYLLKMDLESINNLCTAADPTLKKHKDPRATTFFRGLCEDDGGFWQEKLKVDFKRYTKEWPTWRKEYEKATQELVKELHDAAREGNVKKLKVILKDRRLTADSRSWQRDTALMRAAGDGRIEAMNYLLKQGADVQATNNFGVTPLMIAMGIAHLDIGLHLDTIQLLLDAGANINARDNEGHTALYHVPFANIEDYLVSQGATK